MLRFLRRERARACCCLLRAACVPSKTCETFDGGGGGGGTRTAPVRARNILQCGCGITVVVVVVVVGDRRTEGMLHTNTHTRIPESTPQYGTLRHRYIDDRAHPYISCGNTLWMDMRCSIKRAACLLRGSEGCCMLSVHVVWAPHGGFERGSSD